MKDNDRFLAAVTYGAGEGKAVDRILSDLAHELKDGGHKIAGTAQRSIPRSGRCGCDIMVRDLAIDREVQILEDRGPDARGCRLDPRVLEALVGSTLSALDQGVDAVIINRFGKQEAQGAGFRGLIGQAILRPTPVIIGVNSAYLDSWRSFADGLADELKPDRSIIVDWITPRLRTDAVRRDSFTERSSLGDVLWAKLVERLSNAESFEIWLVWSDVRLTVSEHQTALAVLEEAGVPIEPGCMTGGCGECATEYVEGYVDHKDTCLNADDRKHQFCPCVSRARGTLVLPF